MVSRGRATCRTQPLPTMILKCPSCNSKIKSFFGKSNREHTCNSCKFNFIPDEYMGISAQYDHSDFVDALNENSIIIIMSYKNAEAIINTSNDGKGFCKYLTFAFSIPWIGLFLVAFFTDINENWRMVIFVVTCLVSSFLYKTFHKLKIDRATKMLINDTNLYRRSLFGVKFLIRGNPSFRNI